MVERLTDDQLKAMVEKAKNAYEAQSPVDRARHDLAQRRSGAIGLSKLSAPHHKTEEAVNALPEYVLLSAYDKLLQDFKMLVLKYKTVSDICDAKSSEIEMLKAEMGY